MTHFQKKLVTIVASGALLLNTALPVFAQTTNLTITGNGADSDNTTNVTTTTTTTVVQTNEANISNNVTATSTTGGNEANKNTGGNVEVSTGDATTKTAVTNTANSNVAEVNGCCSTNADVNISGNGAESDNTANLKLATDTEVFQTNDANITNDVKASSDTGKNEAEKNTGGAVSVDTGNATTVVGVKNQANSNVAEVGGGQGNGSVSLMILGNGADSDNTVNLALAKSLTLTQTNEADINNSVWADANTGKNEAEKNTGGTVEVDTGDATVKVGIDNMANFNAAALDCGCLLDVTAKIGGNGAESDNTINAALADVQAAFQTNEYACDHPEYGLLWFKDHNKGCNDVHAKGSTGGNEVEDSTGSVYGDPMVDTGNSETLVSVANTANSNTLTKGVSLELPEFQFDVDFGSNFAHLWAWFTGLMS